ncbi:hypothetical protein [Okeania sp. SIO2B3]|uniref:hypothetical protein n=1 Tax=Okeania sp. SIO2B3 TaxID=2607784 RepID=UPI0013BEFF16|nr:hypothetical protein [Okeania sp. SIO2B3]NET43619.1 hypothetical protein [Okeania sp. SIO2B3]
MKASDLDKSLRHDYLISYHIYSRISTLIKKGRRKKEKERRKKREGKREKQEGKREKEK